jgi:hypothetical protein
VELRGERKKMEEIDLIRIPDIWFEVFNPGLCGKMSKKSFENQTTI